MRSILLCAVRTAAARRSEGRLSAKVTGHSRALKRRGHEGPWRRLTAPGALVSRFQNSYSTFSWIARVRRQKRSIEARMSSADLIHWNGVGSALRASMKASLPPERRPFFYSCAARLPSWNGFIVALSPLSLQPYPCSVARACTHKSAFLIDVRLRSESDRGAALPRIDGMMCHRPDIGNSKTSQPHYSRSTSRKGAPRSHEVASHLETE